MERDKEYIERGALIRLFDERYITAIVQQKHDDVPEDHKKHWKGVQSGTNWCRNTVLEAPAADVVEVVRCGMNGFTVIDNKTGKYPNCEKIALTEEWAKHLIYCDIDAFAITEDGDLILFDDCGNCAFCPSDRFTVVFEKGGAE